MIPGLPAPLLLLPSWFLDCLSKLFSYSLNLLISSVRALQVFYNVTWPYPSSTVYVLSVSVIIYKPLVFLFKIAIFYLNSPNSTVVDESVPFFPPLFAPWALFLSYYEENLILPWSCITLFKLFFMSASYLMSLYNY